MDSISSFELGTFYLILQITIAISAVGGILYKITKFIANKIKIEYKSFCKLKSMVEIIHAELTPNHGSSLKDKVNKIGQQLDINNKATECIMHRQRWLLDNLDEPIFESNYDGEITWVNNKYCNLTGYSVDEILRNGWQNIIHIKDRDAVINEWAAAIKGKRDSRNSYRIVCKNGIVYKVFSVATRNDDFGYIGSMKVGESFDSTNS